MKKLILNTPGERTELMEPPSSWADSGGQLPAGPEPVLKRGHTECTGNGSVRAVLCSPPLQGCASVHVCPCALRILVSSGGPCRGLHLPRGAVPTLGSCAHRQHWWGSLSTYSLGPLRNREYAGCIAVSITKDLSLSLAWPFLPNPQAGNRWTGHGLLGFLRMACFSPVGWPPMARQVLLEGASFSGRTEAPLDKQQ